MVNYQFVSMFNQSQSLSLEANSKVATNVAVLPVGIYKKKCSLQKKKLRKAVCKTNVLTKPRLLFQLISSYYMVVWMFWLEINFKF